MQLRSNTERIVSIDFGSLYTKVQYTNPTTQAAISDIPAVFPCKFVTQLNGGRGTALAFTVPSIIQYSPSGDVVGWGLDPIGEGAVEIKGIKLSLPHEDDRPFHPTRFPVTADSIQRRKSLGKTALTVLTDFIIRLWQACKPQITNNEPGVSWRLIITHPVGWNIDKLEQAIDAAIVTPDQENSTYTICFQTESEAALIAELDSRRGYWARRGNGKPQASGHRHALQATHIWDGETIIVADFGGLTVDVASGRISTHTGIMNMVWHIPPVSLLCGPSPLGDAFVSLLENKARMLLEKLPTSDWFRQALCRWENEILPMLYPGSCDDMTLGVAQEDFKDSAQITHYRWVKHGKLPIHSAELESLMDLYIGQATAAIKKQVEKLRGLGCPVSYLYLTGGFSHNEYVRARVGQVADACGIHVIRSPTLVRSMMTVSHGAVLYGYHISPASGRSDPVGQDSDISIFIGNDPANHIVLVRKGEIIPQRTFKRIPIKGHLMQSCFQQDIGFYKLGMYGTGLEDTPVPIACIMWRQFQPGLGPDDVCVLEIRLQHGVGDGSAMSFIHGADFTMFANGVKQGRGSLASH